MSKVSIHAPVMDANPLRQRQYHRLSVSIHAPVMDAKFIITPLLSLIGFNPRARDGREYQ